MMSFRSNLGKRTDFKLLQPSNVDLMDNSLKSTKYNTVGGDSQTNKCQETPDSSSFKGASKEQMNRFGTDLLGDGTEMNKKKQRRSMLGQRTRLYNTDSVLNVTKNVQLNQNDELNTQTPLHSSSHVENDRTLYRSQPTQKSSGDDIKTPPNPFGYQEVPSEFFDSGINDIGPWSVFKSKQIGIKSPFPTMKKKDAERLHESSAEEASSNAQVKKNVKTKLYDKLTDESFQNGRRIIENLGASVALKSKEKQRENDNLRWPSYKTVKETEEGALALQSSKFQNEEKTSPMSESDVKSSDSDSVDMITDTYEQHERNNMKRETFSDDDSFHVINSTIISAKEKTPGKTPKLSIIREEGGEDEEKHNIKQPKSLITFFDDISSDSPEKTICCENENESIKSDLDNLSELCSVVQKHSRKLDNILEHLLNEKEIYNSHCKELQKAINTFQAKYKDISTKDRTENDMNCSNLIKRTKKKRVISSKLKASPVLMLTPDNVLASPLSIKSSKRRNSQLLKSYSELRKGFSYLQTPERTIGRQRKVRSSLCYTPKSLSSCISEQLKCLDSS